MDLIQIQKTYAEPIKDLVPVYIITKEGKNYNAEGIEFIQNGLKNHFNVDKDLAIYTGIGLNKATVLSALIRNNPNTYIILSTKEKVGFIPQDVNETICLNLEDNPDESSWVVLMKSCHQKVY